MQLNIPSIKDEDLPSLEQITKGFAIIEEKSLEKSSYEEIKNLFNEALGMVPKVVAPNATLNAPIYRVTDGLFPGFNKNKISFFSHPPAEYCRQGRANLAGFPVFYAALSAVTALREFRSAGNISVKKGDILYISKWEVDKQIQYSYSQFTYDDNINLREYVIDINVAYKKKLGEIYSIYSENKRRAIKILLEKLGSFFILDKAYNVSSFLSHHLLYEDRESMPIKIDALLYPSVQAGFEGINYAIHPEFARDHVKLTEVQKVVFDSFCDNGSILNLLDIGKPQIDGSVKWYRNGFDFNNIMIKPVGATFYSELVEEIIIDDNTLFYKNSGKDHSSVQELIWSIVNINKKEFFEGLSEFSEPIDHNKYYEKQMYIPIPEGTIFIKVNDDKYYVSLIVLDIEYKPVLIEIDE